MYAFFCPLKKLGPVARDGERVRQKRTALSRRATDIDIFVCENESDEASIVSPFRSYQF